MLDLLMRATKFTDDLEDLNSELSLAAAQVKESTEALSKDATKNDWQAAKLAELHAQTDVLADKVKQIDERISELKISDRLYLQRGVEHTGIFAKLKTLILGK
jgi:cell division septum initiation protein DivIVA